jgi:hypothetical protein
MNERPRFLADLAKEDRNLQTPRRVEAALRQRVASVRKPGLLTRFRWPAIGALTAAIALWMLFPKSAELPPKSEVAKVAQPMVEQPVSAPTLPPAPVRIAATTRQTAAPASKRKETLPKVSGPAQERITRRFYELAYAPPELLANSRMMRVRIPRAALLSFGLPLNAYHAQDEKVAADVIYTEDGVARAIRFVENNNQE